MKRICVIGCSGAGKSHLSKRLGKELGLPVVHIDQVYWQPGWVNLPMDEFRARMDEIHAREEWILDGNFLSTLEGRLERAEVAIYLDFARWRCFRGAFRRLFSQWGEVRSDMAQGCPESPDLEFYQWIWNFRRDVRPATLSHLAEFPHLKVYLPKNRREVEEVVRELVSGRRGGRP